MGKKKVSTQSRFFDLAFSAASPPISNPKIGLAGAIRRGAEHSYTMNVTLLDAPDQRLIKAGLVLAHRVVDERGEWYLSAPSWAPWLPVEEIEQMGDAELPQRFAELVLPFRRMATLGFVAALTCERSEFVLRDRERRPLAIIRDDKVSASRSGLTFARYREVTIDPINLTRAQIGWLTEMVQHAGGSRLSALPNLVQRLGAIAVDLRNGEPGPEWDDDPDVETYVGGLIGLRHRQLLAADLKIRSGRLDEPEELRQVTRLLRRELSGLACVLDPLWLADVDAELGWFDDELSRPGARTGGILQGERYLRLLDRLVLATRAPEVGQAGANSATDALRAVVEQAATAVAAGAEELREQGASEAWDRVSTLLAQLEASCELCRLLSPEWAAEIGLRAGRLSALVLSARDSRLDVLEARYAADVTVSPHEAFADGREYERRQTRQSRSRQRALTKWPGRMRKLTKALRQ